MPHPKKNANSDFGTISGWGLSTVDTPLILDLDADDAEDLVHLANTPAQAESQLYSLEQTARGIGFYMNSSPWNFVDQFIYPISNILFTESNVNIHIDKVWTVIVYMKNWSF